MDCEFVSEFKNYPENAIKLTFASMNMSLRATQCFFYFLRVNGNAKKVILDGKRYSRQGQTKASIFYGRGRGQKRMANIPTMLIIKEISAQNTLNVLEQIIKVFSL